MVNLCFEEQINCQQQDEHPIVQTSDLRVELKCLKHLQFIFSI